MKEIDAVPGKYYQDFSKGETIRSAGRTVTESDIMNFAGLSGDYNQLHTDKLFAQEGVYGERIAHGLLILAMVSGLAARMGFPEGTALALTKVDWKFRAPVKIGDTIQAEFIVKRKKKVAKMGGGFVEFTIQVYNQNQKVVQKGTWTILVKNFPRG
ncbi:MAG: MaoC/PaaZ C-terminal domain-containing protein [Anaerolineales bacterium]